MTIIIGIDPGSLNTGYGIIKKISSNKLRHIASGVISVKGSEINTRLPIIFQQLQQVIAEYQPEQMVIEQVFMAANPNSALKLGMARGVAILAGSLAGCAIFELSARQAKKFVTGMGAAKKDQVNRMVCKILDLDTPPKLDASDALALAISHAKTITGRARIGKFTASLIDRSSLRRLSDNRNNHLELNNLTHPSPTSNPDTAQVSGDSLVTNASGGIISSPISSSYQDQDLRNPAQNLASSEAENTRIAEPYRESQEQLTNTLANPESELSSLANPPAEFSPQAKPDTQTELASNSNLNSSLQGKIGSSDNPTLGAISARITTSTEINSKDLSLARADFMEQAKPRKRGRPAKVLEISDKNAVENLKINSKRFGVKTGKVAGHNSLEAKIKAILKDKKLSK